VCDLYVEVARKTGIRYPLSGITFPLIFALENMTLFELKGGSGYWLVKNDLLGMFLLWRLAKAICHQ